MELCSNKKMPKDLANGEGLYEEFMDDMEYFINQKGLFRAYDHAAAERKADIEEAEEKGFDRGMMKGQAKGFADGRIEGRLEGHVEGNREKALEIAKKLHAKNFDIREISEITGLIIEDLESVV